MVGKMTRFRPKDVHLIADYQARGLEFDFDPRLTLHLENLTIELFGMSGHAYACAAVHMKKDQVLLTRNIFHGVMTWYLEALPYEWPETTEFPVVRSGRFIQHLRAARSTRFSAEAKFFAALDAADQRLMIFSGLLPSLREISPHDGRPPG